MFEQTQAGIELTDVHGFTKIDSVTKVDFQNSLWIYGQSLFS